MKSPSGRCSPAQKLVRERLLKADCRWFQCITARSAMWALAKSGVRFRTVVRADGTVEKYRQPRLADWEVPRTDPAEKRPYHPAVKAQRRAARQKWKARKREREAAARNAAEVSAKKEAHHIDVAAVTGAAVSKDNVVPFGRS
jgi:hypothetical protein